MAINKTVNLTIPTYPQPTLVTSVNNWTTGLSCSKGSTSPVSIWRGPCSNLGLEHSVATFGWVWRRCINWPNHLRQVSALKCSPLLANGFQLNIPASSWMQKQINTPSTWPGFPGMQVTSCLPKMEWNSLPRTATMIYTQSIASINTMVGSGSTIAWLSTWTEIPLPITPGWMVCNIISPSIGLCSNSFELWCYLHCTYALHKKYQLNWFADAWEWWNSHSNIKSWARILMLFLFFFKFN